MSAGHSSETSAPAPERGFLPASDPATAFPASSELALLDEWGRGLPSWLEDPGFRRRARELRIPPFPALALQGGPETALPLLRLYYVRVGFLASAYINQLEQPTIGVLPRKDYRYVATLAGATPSFTFGVHLAVRARKRPVTKQPAT